MGDAIGEVEVQQSVEQSESTYSAANIMLSVIQKEFEYEVERNRSLESRAGVFLAFVGALIVFLPGYLKVTDLYKVEISTILQAFPYVSGIIMLIITVFTLIIATVYFVRVLLTQKYSRLALEPFNKDNAQVSEDKVCASIMIEYTKIVENNSKANDKKVELYKRGIYLTVTSLIFTVICFIISLFITN